MDKRRIVTWALLLMAPFSIAAKCEGGSGSSECSGGTKATMETCPDRVPNPNPDSNGRPKGNGDPHVQADPNPHDNTTTKQPGVPTVVSCAWGGHRWFQITPEVGGDPLVTFERNASTPRGGEWADTYRLKPGTQVAVTCAPLKNTGDDVLGFAQCVITQDNRVIGLPHGMQHAFSGKVRCWAITPL